MRTSKNRPTLSQLRELPATFRRILTTWGQKSVLVACAVVILVSAVTIGLLLPVTSEENLRSVVSIISEGLIGAFFLVFTISLFIVTLARERVQEYEPWMLRQAFGKLTLTYMALFLVSILVSLLAVMANLNTSLVYLSLIMSTSCIVLLVPYFLNLSTVIDLDPVLLLKRNATEKISRNDSPNRDVSFLGMIASNAFAAKNYFLFWRATDALLEIMLALNALQGQPERKLDLPSTSIEAIEELTDPLYYVRKELEGVCLLTTTEAGVSRKLMAMLLYKCRFIDSKYGYFFGFCSNTLFLVGEAALNQGLSYESERVAQRLWMLGAIATKRKMAAEAAQVSRIIIRYYERYRPDGDIALTDHERTWITGELKNYRLDYRCLERFAEYFAKNQTPMRT